MRQIASIEIHAMVNELRSLHDSYLKKFYDLGNDSFRLLFSSATQSSVVYIKLLQAINLTTITEEVDEPTNFAKGIRKRLLGKKLVSVRQHYSDRIIVLDFAGDEGYRLIIEMFGKGNIILTDKEYMTLLVYNIAKQKDRETVPKAIYQFPESIKVDVDSITKEQLKQIAEKVSLSGERIIKELSTNLDIGPLYLEDVLNRSLINPKSKGNELQGNTLLVQNMAEFFKNVKTPTPIIYSKEGEYVDYAIVPIIKYKDCDAIEFDTLSKAMEKFYLSERTNLERNEAELDQLKANIARQKEILEELKTSEVQCTASGHKIMENMNLINSIINYINQKRRVTVEEMKENFGIVKSIDLKKKDVVIEVE
ncbi:MAG: NFACT family protein [Candidatus Micrarchaeales archaeon]